MSQSDNQCKQILEYLKTGNKLTQLEALNKFGCMRLGARVFDLRERGHDIESKMIRQNGKKFAQYSL